MAKDRLSPEVRSKIMSAVGSEGTAIEMRLRRALWHAGFRYRVQKRIVGTKPDLCFTGAKLAVFVDGCFWHGCPEHYSEPETNTEFWRIKLRGNRRRDQRDSRDLRRAGWTVLRYWECEINDELPRVVEQIAEILEP